MLERILKIERKNFLTFVIGCMAYFPPVTLERKALFIVAIIELGINARQSPKNATSLQKSVTPAAEPF